MSELVEQVRALASQMAASVGCSLPDVLRRTKSRSWMLGRLKRLVEGRTDEEIRDAIVALAQQHRPTAQEEMLERLSERAEPDKPRRHLHGLEPSAWEVWSGRAEQLGSCVVYPMDIGELIRRSNTRLKWEKNFTIQTVSAAEDVGELWWDGRFWQRTQRRLVTMATAKTKTKTERITRHLPVDLKPEDREALRGRLSNIDEERKALEAELAEQTRVLRAKIRERLEAREKVIESLKTGKAVQLVDCEERWQYDLKQVSVVRKQGDDWVLVEPPRPMTKEELQLQIPEAATP